MISVFKHFGETFVIYQKMLYFGSEINVSCTGIVVGNHYFVMELEKSAKLSEKTYNSGGSAQKV